MQGTILNKITNEEIKMYWELFLANIWTEPKGYVCPYFLRKVLVGHINEVHYYRIHLCTGGLTCPKSSWDPNWTTCTYQVSEISTKKGIFFTLQFSFLYNLLRLPVLQAPWLLAWTHLTPCLPLFPNLKAVGMIFSCCLCWISLSFSPPLVCKRFYTFWVWSLHFSLRRVSISAGVLEQKMEQNIVNTGV